MKNRENGQSRRANRRAEHRAENRAENENDYAARAARHNSPENSDKRQSENHINPMLFFEFKNYFSDEFAGNVADRRRD